MINFSKYKEIIDYFNIIHMEKASMDASDRIYLRLYTVDKTLILQDNQGDNMLFEAQIKSYEFLKLFDLPIPDIIKIFPNNTVVIFEDIGTLSLKNFMENNKLTSSYLNQLNEILEKWEHLPIDQYQSPYTPMNEEQYFWGFEFFYEYYVQKYKKSNFPDSIFSDLSTSFKTLSQTINSFENVLIHRDFHSKNIFIKDNKLYIIDFQDLRLGHKYYDRASLIFDLYSNFFPYFKQLVPRQAVKMIYTIAFQRLIKILGNFAYLLIEKNKPDYIKKYENRIIFYLNNIKKYFYEQFRFIYEFLNEEKN